MSKNIIKHIHDASALATYPITCFVRKVNGSSKGQAATKVGVGISIMLVGSTMASNPVVWINHAVWDAMAYGLHGYGALPLLKLLCRCVNLEDLEGGKTLKDDLKAELRAELVEELHKHHYLPQEDDSYPII